MAIRIQKTWKGYKCRKSYRQYCKEKNKAAVVLQQHWKRVSIFFANIQLNRQKCDIQLHLYQNT